VLRKVEKRPLDFYCVYFEIIFPSVDPPLEVTRGQTFLTSSEATFGIGPNIPANIVPDAGSTTPILGLAIFLLFAPTLKLFRN
jgi:hypothetical protein